MPDPNNQSHIVNLQLTIQAAGAAVNGNLYVNITPTIPHTHFLERDKPYEGSPGQILGALRDDGFATTEEGYLMAQAVLSARPAVRTVYVGRREAGETPVESMIAIKDFYGSDPLPWYAFGLPVRDTPSILDVATWSNDEFVTHWALSAEQLVLSNAAGNVFGQLRDADRPRTIIGYSNPTAVATAATVSTVLQTFALAPILTGGVYVAPMLELSVDGGAPQLLPFPSTRAILTASSATYKLNNGELLDIRYNQSTQTTSTVFKGEPAELVSGTPETWDFSGAPVTLSINIDGVGDVLITFLLGDFAVPVAGETAEVALRINTDFGSPIASAVNIDGLNYVKLASATEGTSSSIKVTEGTGANALLLFSTSTITGAGNVGDLSAVEAEEIVALAQPQAGQAAIWEVTELSEPEAASMRFGTGSEVEILGTTSANVLSELGLAVGPINGTGFAVDAGAATAQQVDSVVSAYTGVSTDWSTGKVVFTSNTVTSGSTLQFSLASTALNALGLDDALYTGTGTSEDYAELRLMGFTFAVDLLRTSSNPQFVRLPGALHSGITPAQRTNIKRNHGWMLDPDNQSRTFAVQMANAALQSGAFGMTLETRLAADVFQILATNLIVQAFNTAAQKHSKIPADYVGTLFVGGLLRSACERMGPLETGGSGQFRALGDPADPDFNPNLNSALVIPNIDEVDFAALQNGVFGPYELSLVVLPSGQRVNIDATIIASNIG